MPNERNIHYAEQRIVFYDGECGLCHRTVQTLYCWDKQHVLYFAPIGGETALAILPPEDAARTDTVIFYDRGNLYYRSEALLRLLGLIYPFGSVFRFLLWIPLCLRDFFYIGIAKYRKKLLKKPRCSWKSFDQKYFLS